VEEPVGRYAKVKTARGGRFSGQKGGKKKNRNFKTFHINRRPGDPGALKTSREGKCIGEKFVGDKFEGGASDRAIPVQKTKSVGEKREGGG